MRNNQDVFPSANKNVDNCLELCCSCAEVCKQLDWKKQKPTALDRCACMRTVQVIKPVSVYKRGVTAASGGLNWHKKCFALVPRTILSDLIGCPICRSSLSGMQFGWFFSKTLKVGTQT